MRCIEMAPLINLAMNAICLIALLSLSVASITTATPLEASFETPTSTDDGIEVVKGDAANPLAPALFGEWFRRHLEMLQSTPLGQWLIERARGKQH